MQSDSFFSIGGTFKRAISSFSSAAALSTVLAATILLTGCTEDIKPPSDQTIQALTILGSDGDIFGGLYALESLNAFSTALDRETSLESQAEIQELLTKLGIDIDDESAAAYFSIGGGNSFEFGSAVVFAPITKEHLNKVARGSTIVERQSGDGHEHTMAHEGLFISLIEDGLLLVASSNDRLEMMHARAHGTEKAPGENFATEISDLIIAASHSQFWVASESIQRILKEAPINSSVQEVQLLTKAVAGIAVAFNLDAEAGDSPELSGMILLSAREGIAPSDVADLVRGSIALGKVYVEETEEFITLLNLIEVTERGNIVQIAFRVSVSDIRSLEEYLKSQFTN